MGADPTSATEVHVLACATCPRMSSGSARGWKAYRTDEAAPDDPSGVAFYCPVCAYIELGPS